MKIYPVVLTCLIGVSSVAHASVTIVDENFDGVTLQGQVDENNGNNSSDFTHTMPAGWSMIRNRTDGVEEWAGWSIARYSFWNSVDTANSTYSIPPSPVTFPATNQTRNLFTNASGNILVADADEWCDGNGSPRVNCPGGARLDTQVRTAAYPISSGRRVELSFDHAYYHEVPQTAALNARFSSSTSLLEQFNSGLANNALIRENYSRVITNPLSSTSVQIEWDYFGDNDWYWALDNVRLVCLPASDIDLNESTLVVDDNSQLATGSAPYISTVTFQLKDSSGVNIAEENVLVTFQTNLGTLTSSLGSGSSVNARTDSNGVATATISSNTDGTATVSANVDLDCQNNTAEASISTTPQVNFDPAADISVTKTDTLANFTPGASHTYSITIENAGPQTANNVTLNDSFPQGVTLSAVWTCPAASTTGGATCPASGGAIGDTSVSTSAINLPVGSSVTFLIPVEYSENPEDY